MTNCGAPGCTNRSKTCPDISFHRLPSESRKELRAKWLMKIKRKYLPKVLFICSQHFEPNCFERDLKAELLGKKSRPKLKDDAVPSIFNHIKQCKRRLSSIQREEKQAKRICIDEANQENESIEIPEFGEEPECPHNTADKAIDNTPRMKSIRTQYRKSHFVDDQATTSNNEPLVVKLPTNKKVKDIGVNTDISFRPSSEILMRKKDKTSCVETEKEEDPYWSESDREDLDPTYVPSENEDEFDIPSNSNIFTYKTESQSLPDDTKFIVFWSCLLSLLQNCKICNGMAKIKRTVIKGSMLIVHLICRKNHSTRWCSQPNERKMASGNLFLSAAILFSGNTYQRIREMMDIAKVAFFSHVTFNKIQKRILFPAIHRVFTTNRTLLFDMTKEEDLLDLLGDGRCDSPGYSAKYGTYTVMDSHSGFILDFHVSHCKMAGNSNAMELDGLRKVLQRLEECGLMLASLTTDRHKQVRCFMRKERKHVSHQFDVWHVGRNIKKKLTKIAKKKAWSGLNPWIKSIINHFWWCCASCNGDSNELKEKWVSILHHITDRHHWTGSIIYKECLHSSLTKEDRSCKPFLDRNSQTFVALEKIVLNKQLLSDLKYLASFNHTGTLEVYHSLYNKFCPKRLHFSYPGMIARSQLAVLDFNSGVGVAQAETSKGDLRYKLAFTKVTQSYVIKKIASPKDKAYIEHLLWEVSNIKMSKEKYPVPKLMNVPENIAPVVKPDKVECIKTMRTRFSI